MPKRVQLSRRKGWRMPENTVKVDRSTKWGNPFVIGAGPMERFALDHEGAVGFFRAMLNDPELRAAAGYPDDLTPLRGKNLACWCAGPHCHADVLLEAANADASLSYLREEGSQGSANPSGRAVAASPSSRSPSPPSGLPSLSREEN